jgi:hypothetical protein
MPVLRIEHSVGDFDMWKQVFDGDPADRKGSGVRRYQVFRSVEEPNFVMIDLEFETVEAAQGLLDAMQEIWAGPGAAFMQNPRGRIVELADQQEL